MIILLSGNSSSGKTTFAESLESNYRDTFAAIDSIAPLRRLYDHYYGVYPDSQERKSYVPPGCTLSLQEMLVEEYHFRKRIDPQFSARHVYKEGAKFLQSGYVPVYLNVRNLEEAQSLVNLGSPIITVRLSRKSEVVESSDVYQYDILELVKPQVCREFYFSELNELTTGHALDLVYSSVEYFKKGNLYKLVMRS